MTPSATSPRNGRHAAPTALSGGRGRPLTVTQRLTTALVPILEGCAFADEVMASAARMQTFGATGSRALVVSEAGRLGVRAGAYRERFRAMAGELER